MTENGNGRKIPPHHRMTVKDVIRDYKDGLITAKGAIFYGVSASQPQGKAMYLQPKLVATQLGLHPKTVYRGIAELKLQKRLDFEVDGSLIIKIPVAEKTGVPEYLFSGELSQICSPDGQIDSPDGQNCSPDGQNCSPDGQIDPSNGQNCSPDGQIDPSNGQNCSPDGQICDRKALELFPGANPGSSQLFNYSTNSTRSSLSPLTEKEREKGIENDPDFKQWLRAKVSLLPIKPTLTEQWVKQQAKSKENQEQFRQYQEALKRTESAAIPQTEQNAHDYWAEVQKRQEGGNAQT